MSAFIRKDSKRRHSLRPVKTASNHTPKDEDVNIHIGNAFRRRRRAQAARLQAGSTTPHLEMEFEVHPAQPQGFGRHVQVNEPSAAIGRWFSSTYNVHKDGGLRRPIHRPRRQRRALGAEVPIRARLVTQQVTRKLRRPSPSRVV